MSNVRKISLIVLVYAVVGSGTSPRPATGSPATAGVVPSTRPAGQTQPAPPGQADAAGGDTLFHFGGRGRPASVVFVCDATGTMVDRMPALRRELRKAILGLRVGVQSYQVVLYTDGGKLTYPSLPKPVVADDAAGRAGAKLIVANEDNNEMVLRWLDRVEPMGLTHPLPALKHALALRPELVFFLSDGEFNNLKGYEEVIAGIAEGNARKRTRVNAVLLDSQDAEVVKVMQRIATENNGGYRNVKSKDLPE